MNEHVSLTRYEAARAALDEAVRVDEVQDVRNAGLRMKAYARIAKDKKLQADAASIVIRAERKLGVLLQNAKETGQLGVGRPSKSNVLGKPDDDTTGAEENGSQAEPFSRATLAEAGVDKKLSSRAQGWARLGEAEFEAELQRVRDRIESAGATVVNPGTAEKKARRDRREVELAAKQRALPDRQYGVILADPEWRFEPYSRETGMDRAADNHYPTSSLEEIKARQVPSIAAWDSVLFLWATVPMLPQALEVMAAWGFAYKSHVVWHKKDHTGTGYWFRNEHELLLVGTRGNIPAPAPGTQWPSIISEAPGPHSAKPKSSILMIEEYYPNLPKIELNARESRAGWDCWGNEAPAEESRAKPVVDAVAGSAMSEGEAVASSPETAETGSRLDAGRTASATSEAMDVTSPGGENPAPHSVAADLGGSGAGGEGESGQEIVLPHAGIAPADLTSAQKNHVIRAGYGQNVPLARLVEATGLSKDSVKQRARTMKLSSRERQRTMASAFTTEQNRRRKGQAS